MPGTNIDFVIGAKNQATPVMQTLEKSMDSLSKKTEKVAAVKVETRGFDRLKTAVSGLASAVAPLAAAFAAFKSALAVGKLISDSNAAYDKLAGRFGALRQAQERAAYAMRKLQATIGIILAPIRMLITVGIEALANVLSHLLTPTAQKAANVMSNLGAVMTFVRQVVVDAVNVIIKAFTFLEVVLTNLSSVWELVAATAELYLRKMAGIIMHILTVVIPAYGMWFAENFVAIFKDAFNAVITVIDNAGKIIGEMMYAMFEFISTGGEGGIEALMRQLGQAAGRGLLDGFRAQVGELPKIADREISQQERDLQNKINGINADLRQQFDEKMKKRSLKLGDTFGGQRSPIIDTATVTEGRLLTRGPGSNVPGMLKEILGKFDKLLAAPGVKQDDKNIINTIKDAAGNKITLVTQP